MSDLKRFDRYGEPHVNGYYCNAQEAADLIEQQQARIVKLEQALADQTEETHDLGDKILELENKLSLCRYNALESEDNMDELAATVERLRGALELYVELDAEVKAAEGESVNIAKKALESTPHQNLNAVKRGAYREGFRDGADNPNGSDYFDNEVTQYANQRYPGKE